MLLVIMSLILGKNNADLMAFNGPLLVIYQLSKNISILVF